MSKRHVFKDCESQHRCKVCGCNQQHHTLLHREKTPEANTNKLAISEVNQTAYLQLFPVIASHRTNSVSAVAFLDSGPDSTLISKSLAHKLQLSGKEHNLVLSNVMSMSIKIRSKLISFSISSPSHPDSFKMTNVWVVGSLKLPKQKIDIEDLKNRYQHLRDLYFTSIGYSDAAILIGANFPQLYFTEISKLEMTINPLPFSLH